MIVTIWLVSILAAIYLYLKYVYSYFYKRGINHLSVVPPLGNLAGPTFRIKHFATVQEDIYNAFPDDKFVGMYEFLNPLLIIRDPQLIKNICVKDFDHFIDHRMKINEDNDPLFGRNLLSLKGQKWRDMRSTISPAFTGFKMRHMVPFMIECGRDMSQSLKQQMETKNVSNLDLDIKDLCTRYTGDVVASCAFGLKINSHSDRTNTFFTSGRKASNFTFKQNLIFFAFSAFPRLTEKLRAAILDEDISNFFRSIVQNTMKEREQKKIIRPDMIHLLMEAKKGNLLHETQKDDDAGFATVTESEVGTSTHRRVWTEDDLIAQAAVFVIAGFDGIATVMTFILYELAVNPEVQDKLIREIDESTADQESSTPYDVIKNLKYLDMVVSESLRKWSPGIFSDRICVKPYNLGKPYPGAKEDYIVRPGEGVAFPSWSIHRDPKYFPNPEKFDPERFSDENKHNINPDVFMPFGLGPRNCIGSRFALLESKIMIHQLLTQFRLSPATRTLVPLQICTKSFNLRMKGGHWLKLELR